MKVKKTKPNVKNNSGFSLIEVLLAIVILSLVSAPILRGFIVTANTSARARKILEATDVAQLVVEEISAMSFDDEVQATFFAETEEERLPAIGYSVTGTKVPLDGAHFVTQVGDTCANAKKCYITGTSSSTKIIALPNVDYDNKTYDVVITFEPNSTEGTQYYTYDVTVSVYDQEVTTVVEDDDSVTTTYSHFQNKLVELETQISNKY